MRIAHFVQGRCNPDSANGVDKTAYFLTHAQASLGETVGMFSLTSKPPIPIGAAEVRCYPPKRLPFQVPAELVSDLERWSPDIVHLHSAYVPPNVAVARWARRAGILYVVTPNGTLSSQVLERRKYLKFPYKRLCEGPLLNGAAFVHSVGDAEDILNYGVRTPIVFAPNGIDLDTIPVDLNPEYIREKCPQTKGKKIVLFLGRLSVRHKGLDILVSAFQEASEVYPGMALVLVGPNWQEGRSLLQELLAQLGCGENAIFWGPAHGKEKFDLLASCDIFVHSSRWEGLPFAVLEALACGKPCLVTPAADPLGLVKAYGAGQVINATVDEVAEGLARLASATPEAMAEMSRNAVSLVERELNWSGIARTIIQAYGDALNGHRSPSRDRRLG